jgi:hypothetical protein
VRLQRRNEENGSLWHAYGPSPSRLLSTPSLLSFLPHARQSVLNALLLQARADASKRSIYSHGAVLTSHRVFVQSSRGRRLVRLLRRGRSRMAHTCVRISMDMPMNDQLIGCLESLMEVCAMFITRSNSAQRDRAFRLHTSDHHARVHAPSEC